MKIKYKEESMNFYFYSDAASGSFEADSWDSAVAKLEAENEMPSDDQIKDGAYLVLVDEDAMEEQVWGKP